MENERERGLRPEDIPRVRLREQLEIHGIRCAASLDHLVHKVASREASRINKLGFSEQLMFLLRHMSESEIKQELGV